MSEIPEALVTHKIKYRVRIKIPSKKGDRDYFSYIEQKLLECDGLNNIKVNPVSGSILVHHSTNIGNISQFALNTKIFNLVNNDQKPFDLHSNISKVFGNLNKHFQGLTGGSIDIADVAFLSLLGLGIYQISRGNLSAPAWYTAFWYALGIFSKSGKKINNNLT